VITGLNVLVWHTEESKETVDQDQNTTHFHEVEEVVDVAVGLCQTCCCFCPLTGINIDCLQLLSFVGKKYWHHHLLVLQSGDLGSSLSLTLSKGHSILQPRKVPVIYEHCNVWAHSFYPVLKAWLEAGQLPFLDNWLKFTPPANSTVEFLHSRLV
jgi:hypothetical protein